ncbi:MAG: WYL domain-containing protein [Acidimicrobiia bacterium]|nr:WYL domain-containing protein [Acidimicrobiia bacterium]
MAAPGAGGVIVSRVPAGDRVRRLLALIPWVTANSPVAVDDVCRRFGISRSALLADLEVLPFVGVPPYTPDTMIDVDIDDDVIEMRLAAPFDRPLRLTAPQALALIAAGHSIRAVPGADPGDPLQRALAKVAAAMGVDPDRVHVDLGDVERSTLDALSTAASDRRSVEIGYFTYGRDEHSQRVVDPLRLYADRGNWYLAGWCHRSTDVRVFRLDRIDSVRMLDQTFEPRPDASTLAVFRPSDTDPRVTLDLDASARWVIEQYPCESVDELADGAVRVRMAITARPWLERLLVRLGPAASVVDADTDLATAGVDAARRILAVYGVPGSSEPAK